MAIVMDPFANPDSTGVGGVDFLTMLSKLSPQQRGGPTGKGSGKVVRGGEGGQGTVPDEASYIARGREQTQADIPQGSSPDGSTPVTQNPLNYAMGHPQPLGPKAQAAKDEADALEHQLRAEQLRSQIESHKAAQLEAKRASNPTNSRNQRPMVGPTQKSPTGAMFINGKGFAGNDATGAAAWANANQPRPQQGPQLPSFQQSYYANHPQLAVQRGVPIDRPYDPNNLAIQQMLYGN